MTDSQMPNKKRHHGHNIKRFREILGIKQETLAYELGDDWNQKKISLMEQKETIQDDLLAQVARILKIPVEAIDNFNEEQTINIITNTFNNQDGIWYHNNENCTFHPIEKLVQLHEEKVALYERIIQEKEDMMRQLQPLIKGKS